MEEKANMDYLKREGFPDGLIEAMMGLKKDCAKQIWLIDNSESMKQKDGHVLRGDGQGFQNCTRWEELSVVVRSHIHLSAALTIPSSFRFLNYEDHHNNIPQRFGICEKEQTENNIDLETQVQTGLEILAKAQPHGMSPLTKQVLHICEEIEEMKEELKHSGKTVAIIVCTDGVSTDTTIEFLVDQVRKLEGHPCHLAVRLCTDEPKMVDLYNKLDGEVKIPVDVLVDYQAEAVEICKVNPWLNYAIPIHRAREMGGFFSSRVLDYLDEAPLSKQDQKELCTLLFGKSKMTMCPEAEFDWEGFLAHINTLQKEDQQLHWDPIEEEMKPWVDFGLIEDPKDKLSKRRKIKHKKQLRWFTGGILPLSESNSQRESSAISVTAMKG